ncbi:thioredoxin family protein, partial [Rickettsiaceae bacterium]|nr:thioredoxin family protein [Rickettsiaceae bacterium]
DHIIYAHELENDLGLPTEIKITSSSNLQNYRLHWPEASRKNYEGVGEVLYYSGRVVIPLHITANNPNIPVKFKAEINYAICKDQCIPKQQIIEGEALDTNSSNRMSLILLGLLAIAGGFILNFMPCVLPVLSLKIFSFLKHKDANQRASCAFTIAGIMSSFLVLAGLMLMLRSAGNRFGLGVNFQSPEFIIILTLMITVFISSALGRFNISMPFNAGSNLANVTIKNPYLEHYFSGVLATILSTPCNAPFLGSAVAVAFGASDAIILFTFSLIGAGFSLPYILMIIYPGILTKLPKPGKWMEKFKKILVLMLIGTVLWLLYILHNQIGGRATFGLFMLLLLLKFTIENKAKFILLKLIAIIVLIAASMVLPNYASLEDSKQAEKLDKTWKKFDRTELEKHIANGRIIFVDITADWCITCKYNKFMLLNRDNLMKLFKKHNVIAMRGDITSHNQEIYDYLVENRQVGVPFNIIYGPSVPKGISLPVILKYSDIQTTLTLMVD